ncbi:MAG: tRNA (adenosine(37)-N6)-threonylcarbamoyltransferase complex dimerization subunit type 1 TsaB [Planctomycetes bacterium]|nr:tRNA (adenosine(37)-N6)-threonylcarbamoyltransferase complex dimerization subunit type 1 TsaB [Planctomycetota bacterium]
MKTLAIETSHVVGSVAVAEGPDVLAEESFEQGMVHGRELVPRMKALLERVGWGLAEVELIAVSIGPGSYTGLRVGVAAVKTIAYALGTPVVAVPSLDVLARNAPDDAEVVCPVVDAKRKQVYTCRYDGSRNRQGDHRVVHPQELAQTLSPGAFVLGDGLAYYADVFERRGFTIADESLWRPRAAVVAALGRALYMAGQRDDSLSLVPLYLRRPEAEDKWREKQEQIQAGGEK